MRLIKIFLILVFFNAFFIKLSLSEEKLPLNNEQKALVAKYNTCEEYSECQFETLTKLIEIIDARYENYELILGIFVESLVLQGEAKQWNKYEKLIDDYLFSKDTENDGYKVWISSLWGWRYYSVNEIQNYEKALKLLNYSIKTSGNEEMTGNAYYSLGVIYEQGRAVKQDFKKSIKYYFEAAKRGDHYSFNRIAIYYILGNNVIKKDFNKAVKYLKLSNTSWVANSEVSLLKILFEKERLPKDIKELELWVLDDYKNTKNVNNFNKLARGFEISGDYKNAFKYHYLITKILGQDDGFSSVLEIKNFEDLYISKDESIKLKLEGDLILKN